MPIILLDLEMNGTCYDILNCILGYRRCHCQLLGSSFVCHHNRYDIIANLYYNFIRNISRFITSTKLFHSIIDAVTCFLATAANRG